MRTIFWKHLTKFCKNNRKFLEIFEIFEEIFNKLWRNLWTFPNFSYFFQINFQLIIYLVKIWGAAPQSTAVKNFFFGGGAAPQAPTDRLLRQLVWALHFYVLMVLLFLNNICVVLVYADEEHTGLLETLIKRGTVGLLSRAYERPESRAYGNALNLRALNYIVLYN